MSKIPAPSELFAQVRKDNTEVRERCKDALIREMKKRAPELAKGEIYIDEPKDIHRVFEELKQEFRTAGWVLRRGSSPKNESYIAVKALPTRDSGDQRDCNMSSWFDR